VVIWTIYHKLDIINRGIIINTPINYIYSVTWAIPATNNIIDAIAHNTHTKILLLMPLYMLTGILLIVPKKSLLISSF